MAAKRELVAVVRIAQSIHLVRGQKVMLDSDLAALYGVTTGNLNKAVTRNGDRFPSDFCFRLRSDEAKRLIFQIGISNVWPLRDGDGNRNRKEIDRDCA